MNIFQIIILDQATNQKWMAGNGDFLDSNLAFTIALLRSDLLQLHNGRVYNSKT